MTNERTKDANADLSGVNDLCAQCVHRDGIRTNALLSRWHVVMHEIQISKLPRYYKCRYHKTLLPFSNLYNWRKIKKALSTMPCILRTKFSQPLDLIIYIGAYFTACDFFRNDYKAFRPKAERCRTYFSYHSQSLISGLCMLCSRSERTFQ